jgi:hypothetical protein
MGYRSRRCGDYLLILQKPPLLPKRLQREFPDYHQRFLEGEFPSAYAAAKACGLLPYAPNVAN